MHLWHMIKSELVHLKRKVYKQNEKNKLIKEIMHKYYCLLVGNWTNGVLVKLVIPNHGIHFPIEESRSTNNYQYVMY